MAGSAGSASTRDRRRRPARAGLLVFGIALAAAGAAVAPERISAESLRTNITWLAADARGGRMTPSPGLEASADYIAQQFRLAGLAPGAGNGSYFQFAAFTQITPRTAGFRMELEAGGRSVTVRAENVSARALTGLDYDGAPVVVLPAKGAAPAVAGKIVAGGEAWASESGLYALEARKPALILLAEGRERTAEDRETLMEADAGAPPVIRIFGRAAAGVLAGRGEVKLTLHAVAPERRDARLRNVAGMLRGSDPAARDQVVIVSAHYDHLGMRPPGPGNRVYHGANDDASGTASLIEIGRALAAGTPHPRRTVLFLALFGEEEGLLGSAYYVRHPLVPLAHTIADINLEQLGRTDTSEGTETGRFAFTGPSYSTLPRTMSDAARAAGVTVYRKENGDDYFDRSDNYSFALAGIVAHTAVVAFEFPDYHAVSDEADKIDYGNLARVDRGLAAGIEAVADAAAAPEWSDAPGARIYREAAGSAAVSGR